MTQCSAVSRCGQLHWPEGGALTKIFAYVVYICLLAGFIFTLTTPAAAQTDERAVARTYQFLNNADRAKATLNFVHFGTDYKGQEYRGKTNVIDNSKRVIPGHFTLTFRLFWNDDGYTDVVYFCDMNGRIYEVQIGDTNAEGNKPFLWANVSIQLLGNFLIEAYKDKLSDDDRRQLHKFVADADAHGLLEFSIKIDQFSSQ